jgi:hypothetical protein
MKCPVCGDDFEIVYSLANCDNVCGKCCTHSSSCSSCENYDLQPIKD